MIVTRKDNELIVNVLGWNGSVYDRFQNFVFNPDNKNLYSFEEEVKVFTPKYYARKYMDEEYILDYLENGFKTRKKGEKIEHSGNYQSVKSKLYMNFNEHKLYTLSDKEWHLKKYGMLQPVISDLVVNGEDLNKSVSLLPLLFEEIPSYVEKYDFSHQNQVETFYGIILPYTELIPIASYNLEAVSKLGRNCVRTSENEAIVNKVYNLISVAATNSEVLEKIKTVKNSRWKI